MDKELRNDIVQKITDHLYEELKADHIIDAILKYVDIRKLLDYGQILIEEKDDKVVINGYGSNDYNEQTVIDSENKSMSYGYEQDNEGKIRAACEVARTVVHMLGFDNSKHAKFRFECGLDPNDDEEFEKLGKVIDDDTRQKLYDAGYDIIKSVR